MGLFLEELREYTSSVLLYSMYIFWDVNEVFEKNGRFYGRERDIDLASFCVSLILESNLSH